MDSHTQNQPDIQYPFSPPSRQYEGQQLSVTDMGSLLSRLLSNEYIPEEVKDQLWLISSDDIVLSNLSEKNIQFLMIQFELLELRTIRDMPGHDYDSEFRRLFTMAKAVYFAKLNRAKDGFERKTQATQISTNIVEAPPQDTVHNKGWLSTIISKFTGR